MLSSAIQQEKIRVGIVSFTEVRDVDLVNETVQYENQKHQELSDYLEGAGFEVLDPMRKKKGPGAAVISIKSLEDIDQAIAYLKKERADCLIVGAWKWTEPMLAVRLVKELAIPTLLFGKNDENRTALGCMMAIGAALWEIAPHKSALLHERILGDFSRVEKWARGVGALQKMRCQSIMLWGGSYCLKMDHLQDDPSRLKAFLIGDILNESEYLLIKKAEEISEKTPSRVENFISWLKENNCQIVFDERMFSLPVFKKQAALYLASRDRLEELKNENIVGVSIHCQPALSIAYGVTGCFLPAFLPFGQDSEGQREVVAAVCEGDIKGLLTSVMLQNIASGIPAGFGDVRTISVNGRDVLLIGNCGGASIFYAANSLQQQEVLPKVSLQAQCQGAAGGAVGYKGIGADEVTVARLIRVKGNYLMQLAVGQAKEVNEEMLGRLGWGRMWPQIAVDIGISAEKMARVFGSNHYSLIPGCFDQEVEYFCRQASIPLVRLDKKVDLENFYQWISNL